MRLDSGSDLKQEHYLNKSTIDSGYWLSYPLYRVSVNQIVALEMVAGSIPIGYAPDCT
jgi:hypothetical protein